MRQGSQVVAPGALPFEPLLPEVMLGFEAGGTMRLQARPGPLRSGQARCTRRDDQVRKAHAGHPTALRWGYHGVQLSRALPGSGERKFGFIFVDISPPFI